MVTSSGQLAATAKAPKRATGRMVINSVVITRDAQAIVYGVVATKRT